MTFGPPLVAIYIISDVGSVAGGWLSSTLIKRGWSVNAGRKTAMLVCALCVPPVMLAPGIASVWGAVLLIGLATAAHQGFSANLYTLPSDLFPRKAVGAIIGIGGTLGAVGGMFMAKFTGWVLDTTGSYMPMFVDRRLDLSGRAAGHPPARAAHGAGQGRLARILKYQVVTGRHRQPRCSPLAHPGGDGGAATNLELVQYVVDVILDGRRTDAQVDGDLLVGHSLRDQGGHLALPAGERLAVFGRGSGE